MIDLGKKLQMLYQMRWRHAHLATGLPDDVTTANLLHTQQVIRAMEAAFNAGAPELVWSVGWDGLPLDPSDPAHQTPGAVATQSADDREIGEREERRSEGDRRGPQATKPS